MFLMGAQGDVLRLMLDTPMMGDRHSFKLAQMVTGMIIYFRCLSVLSFVQKT